MTASLTLVLLGTAVLLAAGLPALLARGGSAGRRLGAALAVLAAGLGLPGAVLGLLGPPGSVAVPWSVPGGSLALGLDGLSAAFLLPVFLVPALASVYGLGYEQPRAAAGQRAFFALLGAGMALLVLARNSVLFLVGWETMALAAFFLIGAEHQRASTRQAAWVYLVATHLGTACLLGAFLLLAGPDGSLDWPARALAALPPGRAAAAFALALLGFGCKAGLMPLHFWLPAAHSNAPSHASAVLSGVMLKMGVYGLLRVLALLPPLPSWCGALLLLLGALTALLGVAATLGQGDLKRLLAYSSIENLGIVAAGVGLAVLGRTLGRGDLVVLGLGGALLHVLNHGVFKPLLFFGAGSVLHATGTREMDDLGGLLRAMPRTGLCFLCGAGAISGLPPLNGFVSEFVLYLGLFAAATTGAPWLALLAAAALAALALVGGLALVAFVRATAIVFLGRGRSPAADGAHDPPAAMTAPMLVLAGLCLGFGLLPGLPIALLAPAAAATLPLPAAAQGLAAPPLPPLGTLVPVAFLSALAPACALLLLGSSLLLARRWRARIAARPGTWACAYVDPGASRLQYTAASLAQFAAQVLRWTVRERLPAPAPRALFPAARAFLPAPQEPLLDGLLWPWCRALAERCSRLRFLQHGRLQIYLLYILVTLLLLLGWSALADWRP